MDKKIKILALGDHPLLPSGVGTQSKYVFEALLKTGKFKIMSLGGAISHPNYQTTATPEWGEDFLIKPIDGYGDRVLLRNMIQVWRPDIVWFMTDPRFYEWLWKSEKEVRPYVPMVYYHVWDNYPAPLFNKTWYDSTDTIACISKLTYDIVKEVKGEDSDTHYVPHAVNPEYFKDIRQDAESKDILKALRKENNLPEDKFVFFWNNRNARRKQTGTLLSSYSKLLKKIGTDKTVLLMHTDPRDPHGQPISELQKAFEIPDNCFKIHTQKVPPAHLNYLYNLADCTINIANAEGFGLATLESLATKTPVVATMTGGLQEQVYDGENYFGVGITPVAKSMIGSQATPYIYEDHVSEEQVVQAMETMINMPKEEYDSIAEAGYQHVVNNYNFKIFQKQWVDLMTSVHERYGSWESRKNYKNWELRTL